MDPHCRRSIRRRTRPQFHRLARPLSLFRFRTAVAQGSIVNPKNTIQTDALARLDNMPWTRFHTLLIVALGVGWALDSFETNIIGSVFGVLKIAVAFEFRAGLPRCQRVGVRDAGGRDRLRLSGRPVWPQAALSRHVALVRRVQRDDGVLMELRLVPVLSRDDRVGRGRRIFGCHRDDGRVHSEAASRQNRLADSVGLSARRAAVCRRVVSGAESTCLPTYRGASVSVSERRWPCCSSGSAE